MARPLRSCSLVFALTLAASASFAQSSSPLLIPQAARPPQPAAAPTPLGSESAMLAALRAAEEEAERRVDASTVAQAAARDGTTLGADTLPADVAARIAMPDIPLRMTPRLARSLAMFRTDARARRLLGSWVRKSNRYRHRIQQTLLAEGLPASLVWVAAAESAFDPRAESSVGAMGLWQFMPDAGRSYGLRVDAWVDERRDPDRATLAAARYLRDLHARFGTWELAFAAYNMGYNALLRAIRKYNTNDFEALASLEAGLPLETMRYVPRILSFAIASQNPSLFELENLQPDPVVAWDDVEVTASLTLAEIARGAGVAESELRALNPALLRSRTPPCEASAPFVLHVPRGAGSNVRGALAQMQTSGQRPYVVRQGESLDEIAGRWGMRPGALLALSGLGDAATARPGVTLMVPAREPTPPTLDARPVVAVEENATPGPAGGDRVFVRVAHAEDVAVMARALRVTPALLAQWNHLDPNARLQPAMWLQAWVSGDPSGAVRVWREAELDLVHRGSDAFHDRAVAETGQVRLRVTVREGDTMASLARRFHITVGRIARINHLERDAALTPGAPLVLYVDPAHASPEAPTAPEDAPPAAAPPAETAAPSQARSEGVDAAHPPVASNPG
jgi:membrane-bound lytic murein transglycosylase D